MRRNYIPERRTSQSWLRDHWRWVLRVFFASALITGGASLTSPIFDKYCKLTLILMFASYLLSQKIENRRIQPFERAFSYFLSYGLGLALLTDVRANFLRKPTTPHIAIIYLLMVLPLMVFQTTCLWKESASWREKAGIVSCSLIVTGSMIAIYLKQT